MKQWYVSVQEREMKKCSEKMLVKWFHKLWDKERFILRFFTEVCPWLDCTICEHFCVTRDYYLPGSAHCSSPPEMKEIYRQTSSVVYLKTQNDVALFWSIYASEIFTKYHIALLSQIIEWNSSQNSILKG